MRRLLLSLLAFSALLTAAEAAEISWDEAFWNPRAMPDDLALPLPCGGGLAFRRIATPLATENPLEDRKIQLGAADETTGFLDYFRSEHLRGSFGTGGETHYWLMKYELTRDQLAALAGECREPSAGGARPAGGLSWFEAIALSQTATEWLRAEVPDALPSEDGALAFLRLPTEAEWEFAARGGVEVDPVAFRDVVFPMDGPLEDYAWVAGRASANGSIRPIGRIEPNPLGLFGMLGGVEELMLEPFRLNALGRPHGQIGGFVTRGGSIETEAAEMRASLRQENPFFLAGAGAANAYETFGVRFALSVHVNTSLARTNVIRNQWLAGSSAEPALVDDPLDLIAQMRERESDKARLQELATLRSFVTADRSARAEASARALRLSVANGAAMLQLLRSQAKRVENFEGVLVALQSAIERREAKGDQPALLNKRRQQLALKKQELLEAVDLLETISNGYLNIVTTLAFEHEPNRLAEEAAVLKIELDSRGETPMVLVVDDFVARTREAREADRIDRQALITAALE